MVVPTTRADPVTKTSKSVPAVYAYETLVSPPAEWPKPFKQSKELQSFLGKTLKASRVRLVEPPNEADAAMAATALANADCDGFERATLLSERLGWSVVSGFVLSQLKENTNAFVAEERWWNAKPTGVWINAWPHAADAPEGAVLVESPLARQPPPQRTSRGVHCSTPWSTPLWHRGAATECPLGCTHA